ncbi:hypothetical protein [Bacillus aquiflavi]|nr:hypothetical protein [Bacillus aquiflavi]
MKIVEKHLPKEHAGTNRTVVQSLSNTKNAGVFLPQEAKAS